MVSYMLSRHARMFSMCHFFPHVLPDRRVELRHPPPPPHLYISHKTNLTGLEGGAGGHVLFLLFLLFLPGGVLGGLVLVL